MVIIAGHTRHLAAKQMGMDEVPIVVSALEADEARAFRIADNRTADFSEWDLSKLRIEFDEIEFEPADWDFDFGREEPPSSEESGSGETIDVSLITVKCFPGLKDELLRCIKSKADEFGQNVIIEDSDLKEPTSGMISKMIENHQGKL